MQNDHYETWLAKQAAMGRRVPVTTAPYYAPAGSGKTVVVETDTHMGIPYSELLGGTNEQ